jgi:AcrR family transcriptional regulator
MPPEERRAAIIAATRPLVMEHGADVSTRQIADACGLAEGTLFRVFPNKDAIVHAAVDELLDPVPLVAAIGGIDRTRPVAAQMTEAIHVLHEAGRRIVGVMSVLHPKRRPGEAGAEPKHPAHAEGEPGIWTERREAPMRALTALLEPSADQLRTSVPAAASFIRGAVFAATFPLTADDQLDPDTLSDLIVRALVKES